MLPPMTMEEAPGARLTVVPSTCIVLPAARVWPAMTNADDGFAVMIDPPKVIEGR